MLEFIVLGQIPGTNLVITFSWLLACMTLAVGAAMLQHTHRKHHHATNVDLITL